MSEQHFIQAIATAVVQQLAQSGYVGQQQAPAQPAPSFVPPTTPPVTQQAPAAPAMPPTPSFLTPATPPPAPAGPVAPFTDAKGLTDYVMATYKALGPEKGAQIQSIIAHLGHQNVNDVKPEQYGAFYGFVEQLKAA